MKDSNPFDLKVLAKAPKDYLDTDEFFDFLVKKNISVRKDNSGNKNPLFRAST